MNWKYIDIAAIKEADPENHLSGGHQGIKNKSFINMFDYIYNKNTLISYILKKNYECGRAPAPLDPPLNRLAESPVIHVL